MGSNIEAGIGPVNTIILYFLSGFGGILFSMDVHPNAHGVGASTAIFGLVGFYFSYLFTDWSRMGRIRTGQRIGILIYVSVTLLLNSPFLQLDPHIDNMGHLGGFITGALVGFAISEQYDAQARAGNRAPDRYTEEEYNNKSACCCFFWRFF